MPKKIKSYFLLIVFIFSSLNGMEIFVPLCFNIQNTVKNNYAFIVTQDGTIGMVTDEYYFTKNINLPQGQLFSLNGDQINSSRENEAMKGKLSEFSSAFFETAAAGAARIIEGPDKWLSQPEQDQATRPATSACGW